MDTDDTTVAVNASRRLRLAGFVFRNEIRFEYQRVAHGHEIDPVVVDLDALEFSRWKHIHIS